MKLTKREVFLLKLAGVVLILAFSYHFIIEPERIKSAAVEEELTEKRLEVDTVKAEIGSIPKLEEEETSLRDAIQTGSERFYPDILQKKLIVILDQVIQDTGVTVDSLDFSYITQKTVESIGQADPAESQPAQAEGKDTDPVEQSVAASEPEIETMSVTIPFLGTYEQVMELIKQLEGMNREIVINSLQIAQGEDGRVSGEMSLDFYALSKPALSSADPDYLGWPYDNPHGVRNPFRFLPEETEK